MEHYGKKLLVVCHRYATLTIEPSDIFQEAFIQIFSVLDKYDASKGVIEGWLHRITVNVALKQIRKHQRYDQATDIDDLVNENTLTTELNDSLTYKELLGFIKRLPEVQQVVFNLYAIDGYSHDEIGEQLNITASTSRLNYSRAKKKLQEMYMAHNHEG